MSRSDLKEQAAEIIEILRDIAYQSGSQDELTGNLTLLRNVCIDANRKDIFDRCLGITKDGGIDTEDMDGHELRFKYNTDDFANSEEPYREVFDQPTAFLKQRALDRLAAEAQKCGYRGFKATYKAFEKSMRQINTGSGALLNPSDFPQQPRRIHACIFRVLIRSACDPK